MDSFKDVLEAAQLYCKGQMAEPTYNLYIDGLEPVSFEDSSHITLSVRNDFICKIVSDRYLGLLKEAFKSVFIALEMPPSMHQLPHLKLPGIKSPERAPVSA